jgi:hypothetical protein
MVHDAGEYRRFTGAARAVATRRQHADAGVIENVEDRTVRRHDKSLPRLCQLDLERLPRFLVGRVGGESLDQQ